MPLAAAVASMMKFGVGRCIAWVASGHEHCGSTSTAHECTGIHDRRNHLVAFLFPIALGWLGRRAGGMTPHCWACPSS